MHLSMIEYRFKPERFEEGLGLWKEIVLEGARDLAGLIELRLLELPPLAVALGSWEDLGYAQAYMKTGVFQRFLSRAGSLLDGALEPPRTWALAARQDGAGFGSLYREPEPPQGLDPGLLADFLCRAKRATWAAGIAPGPASRPGSLDLAYAAEGLSYEDSYFGSTAFSGQELLRAEGRPVWSMNYYGRSEPEAGEGLGPFLRAALSRVEAEAPFRGPRLFAEGEWRYLRRSEGGLGRFSGEETIDRGGRVVYRLGFLGGWIV